MNHHCQANRRCKGDVKQGLRDTDPTLQAMSTSIHMHLDSRRLSFCSSQLDSSMQRSTWMEASSRTLVMEAKRPDEKVEPPPAKSNTHGTGFRRFDPVTNHTKPG
mmetsp:Transcript_114967/g.336304  ORF Transcript_114967/g.336304 Transcript_114967/m.336304 type:complete len:105 (+) Transcript_114967:628-942(+)